MFKIGFMYVLKELSLEHQLSSITDSELIKQASAGDSEAFSELYSRYVERIYNYVYYRTSNANDAED